MSNLNQPLQIHDSTKQAPKKQPKKLKVRHLSELTKRIIVERYASLMDFDEVAVVMEIPGLTGKTVCNVIASAILDTRKPPAREVTISQVRRIA
jgi:hypothetical protein